MPVPYLEYHIKKMLYKKKAHVVYIHENIPGIENIKTNLIQILKVQEK